MPLIPIRHFIEVASVANSIMIKRYGNVLGHGRVYESKFYRSTLQKGLNLKKHLYKFREMEKRRNGFVINLRKRLQLNS